MSANRAQQFARIFYELGFPRNVLHIYVDGFVLFFAGGPATHAQAVKTFAAHFPELESERTSDGFGSVVVLPAKNDLKTVPADVQRRADEMPEYFELFEELCDDGVIDHRKQDHFTIESGIALLSEQLGV